MIAAKKQNVALFLFAQALDWNRCYNMPVVGLLFLFFNGFVTSRILANP